MAKTYISPAQRRANPDESRWSDGLAEDVDGDGVGQGDARGRLAALTNGDDAGTVTRDRDPGTGHHPGARQQGERLGVDLHGLADAPDRHDRRGVADRGGQGAETGEEVRVLAHPQLVEPRDGVAVGRLETLADEAQYLALDLLGHDVLPPAGLVVGVLPLEADDVDEQALGQPVLAHDTGGEQPAVVGQFEVTVARDGDEPVTLHAR